jgi:heat-inducible transcriptional repressor
MLEEHGLLAHPHTSAGRVPTDAGHRFYVDRLLGGDGGVLARRDRGLDLQLMRREVDAAMRATTETLSQVTNLLAIVSAPPLDTATIRHVEVLALQPQVLMVVVITSTGGVTKRVFTSTAPVDPGLAQWAAEYLNERLTGMGLGARMLHSRLKDPSLGPSEQAFLDRLAPAFTELAETAEHTLYFDGAARLLSEHRFQDLTQINELMTILERRVALLDLLRSALSERDVFVRIGSENELPALRSLALVAASYGLPARKLGTVSLIGPVSMDYAGAIRTVREAALQLSRFVEDVYEG